MRPCVSGSSPFHWHPLVPFPATAELHVGWVAFGSLKPGVGQHDHLTIIVCRQGRKGLVARVGRGAMPIGNQAQLVERDTELAANG